MFNCTKNNKSKDINILRNKIFIVYLEDKAPPLACDWGPAHCKAGPDTGSDSEDETQESKVG